MRGISTNGELIRSARKHCGLTQEQLAELAALDVKTIRSAEHGSRMDLGTLTRLAFALQVDVNQLVIGDAATTWEQRRREIIWKWCQAWDGADLMSLMEMYHHDAVLHLPGGPNIPFGGTYRGHQQIRDATQTAWITCRTDPVTNGDIQIFVNDAHVVLNAIKGVLLPTGEPLRLWCMQLFAFEAELIVEQRVEFDTVRFAHALQLPTPTVPRPPDESSLKLGDFQK